jgi:membrane fusion protein, heavy metal efflux system
MSLQGIVQIVLVLAVLTVGALAGLKILSLDPAVSTTRDETEEGHAHEGEEGHGEGQSGEGHGDEHREAEGEEHGEGTRIGPQTAKAAGIETAQAGPAQIRQTLVLQGQIEYDVQRVRRAMARYPGVILMMSASIGDRVQAGEVLAEVESDDSLQTYAIRAPIGGIVTQQLANVGETTTGRGLYVIADLSQVWVDLAVFRGDQARVQIGQPVRVRSLDEQLEATGKIGYLAPISSALSQSTTARIFLDNPKSIWQPGMAVTGEVVVAEEKVPLAVRNSALQSFEGSDVVFIREGEDTYEPRALELGRTDGEHTEVLDGLAPGTEYVAENSYLIKADIEKASAEHAH